jgi:hypothetical protein
MWSSIGRGVPKLPAAVLHPLEVDAEPAERVGQPDAVAIDQAPRLVEVEVAGAGRGSEQAPPEPRTLLVGPVDQAHRDRRPAAVLRVDAPQDLHPGEHVEAAVQPAAVRHRVHVAADQERAVGLAGERRPGVPGGIVVDLDRERLELRAEPGPCPDPGVGEGHALGAVLVAGEFSQFLQLGDGALGVERVHESLRW